MARGAGCYPKDISAPRKRLAQSALVDTVVFTAEETVAGLADSTMARARSSSKKSPLPTCSKG